MSATVSINHIPRCLLPHQADKDDKNLWNKILGKASRVVSDSHY